MLSPKITSAYTDTIFPDEFDEKIAGKNETSGAAAILPVGSVEAGGHLLMGCDGYHTLALADMIAKKVDGVVFPLIPFSFVGGLRMFAGTIDMRAHIAREYIENVCLQIFRQGFGKIILLNCHGGGIDTVYSAARNVYKIAKKPVISMFTSRFFRNWPEIKDIWPKHGMDFEVYACDTSKLIASLRYLGYEKQAQKVIDGNYADLEKYGEIQPDNNHPLPLGIVNRMGGAGSDWYQEARTASPRKVLEVKKFRY